MTHVGHNVLSAFRKHQYTKFPSRWDIWYTKFDQIKIVLKGGTEQEITTKILKAREMNIPFSFVTDVHLKERICAVIGPVNEGEAQELGLHRLRLY